MTDRDRIQVLIVDDHDMLREGLFSFLAAFPDLEFVGDASNGEEAIRLCRELNPDVVLIDLVMPELDGVTAISVIHKEQPEIVLIALTTFKDDDLVKSALRAGATNYLLKNISATNLAEAIRAAKRGISILSPEIVQTLADIQTPILPDNDLTPREKEVLSLLVEGRSNADIAQQLGISVFTVKNHMRSLLSKMKVNSRTEAVSHALQNNLVHRN